MLGDRRGFVTFWIEGIRSVVLIDPLTTSEPKDNSNLQFLEDIVPYFSKCGQYWAANKYCNIIADWVLSDKVLSVLALKTFV